MGTVDAQLKPGDTLRGYTIIGLLARGGMAELYLARRAKAPSYEAPVVIKRMLPHLGRDREFVEMFLEEQRLARMLRHPNIVRIEDVIREHDNYGLVMEYLDGRNMLQVARASNRLHAYLPPVLLAHVLHEILAALYHAHTFKLADGTPCPIVHRDISPDNILITFTGHVKLADFGIAKAANSVSRTRAGVVKGKMRYVSPEAVVGDPIDGRSDLFSMGVTLYELLTNYPPFTGKNDIEVARAICLTDPRPPQVINLAVPEGLAQICMRALSKDREDRYADARVMQQALATWIAASGASVGREHLAAYLEVVFPDEVRESRERARKLAIASEASSRPPPLKKPPPPQKKPAAAAPARPVHAELFEQVPAAAANTTPQATAPVAPPPVRSARATTSPDVALAGDATLHETAAPSPAQLKEWGISERDDTKETAAAAFEDAANTTDRTAADVIRAVAAARASGPTTETTLKSLQARALLDAEDKEETTKRLKGVSAAELSAEPSDDGLPTVFDLKPVGQEDRTSLEDVPVAEQQTAPVPGPPGLDWIPDEPTREVQVQVKLLMDSAKASDEDRSQEILTPLEISLSRILAPPQSGAPLRETDPDEPISITSSVQLIPIVDDVPDLAPADQESYRHRIRPPVPVMLRAPVLEPTPSPYTPAPAMAPFPSTPSPRPSPFAGTQGSQPRSNVSLAAPRVSTLPPVHVTTPPATPVPRATFEPAPKTDQEEPAILRILKLDRTREQRIERRKLEAAEMTHKRKQHHPSADMPPPRPSRVKWFVIGGVVLALVVAALVALVPREESKGRSAIEQRSATSQG